MHINIHTQVTEIMADTALHAGVIQPCLPRLTYYDLYVPKAEVELRHSYTHMIDGVEGPSVKPGPAKPGQAVGKTLPN